MYLSVVQSKNLLNILIGKIGFSFFLIKIAAKAGVKVKAVNPEIITAVTIVTANCL